MKAHGTRAKGTMASRLAERPAAMAKRKADERALALLARSERTGTERAAF